MPRFNPIRALLPALVCCGAVVAAAAASTGAPSGKIAFASNRDGDTEIYVMSPGGSGVRRLTHTPKFDGPGAMVPGRTQAALLQPALSPAATCG